MGILKMSKPDLLGKIQSGRDELEQVLNKVSEQQKLLVILHGEWSTKDLLGHLGFWENRVAELYEALHAGNFPEPALDLNRINAKSFMEMREKTLLEVEVFERDAFLKVLEVVRKATDDELFGPSFFTWTNGTSFQELISDNTWGHYVEHVPEITAWLKRIA